MHLGVSDRGVEPGDWPTGCTMCGQLIGALSAVILVAVLGPIYVGAGFLGMFTIAFFGGNFGANVAGNLVGLTRGRITAMQH